MRKIKAEDIIVGNKQSWTHHKDGSTTYSSGNITLNEELSEIYKDIDALRPFNSLKKSIDLILQELKLNPDEWEYKTEKKLVKIKK